MAEENLTEVVASGSNTDSNLTTSYDNLQERLDYLYDEEWFTPNAFYPSLFKRATDNEGLSNQLHFRKPRPRLNLSAAPGRRGATRDRGRA